jgi:MtN3 and saliva related transmembrane protein
MATIAFLGLIAGVLTTASAVPQVVRTWKLKRTYDISLGMYVLVTAGMLLWLIYGLLIHDVPLIAANIVSLILNATVLCFKIKYG